MKILILFILLTALLSCEKQKDCYQCQRYAIDYYLGIPIEIYVSDTFELCNETGRQIEKYIKSQTDSAYMGCDISRKCWAECELITYK